MKRLLILLGLLVALLVPQMAQAESFYFGKNAVAGMSFDDQEDVATNLGYLALLDSNAEFASASVNDFDLATRWQYTGIGFSQFAVDKGLSGSAWRRDESVSAADGMRFQDEYFADNINMSWFDDGSHGEASMTLQELITDCVSTVYVLQSDISFKLDNDSELFTFKAGTIFFGIALPDSGKTLDFIMAAGPLAPPAVPVPAAVWLMGTGVAGVLALRRKIK